MLDLDLSSMDLVDPEGTRDCLRGCLPGQPRIGLNDADQLADFLEQELVASDLERMAPHLWMMSTQSSANINSLHRQQVKERAIVITEDARLHLVWHHDRIYVKPLPKYLLCREFWSCFLLDRLSPLGDRRESIKKAALGYMRTYCHLVRHESDFELAQRTDVRLVPKDVDWPDFCRLMSPFEKIPDIEVSGRYCYGELRLTRLNFYIKIFLRKFQYEQIHTQYSSFFARFYGPLLFVFGIFSIILSAMQVGMAVEQVSAHQWRSFWTACRWFSILSCLWAAAVGTGLLMLLVWLITDEWFYAVRQRMQKKKQMRGLGGVSSQA